MTSKPMNKSSKKVFFIFRKKILGEEKDKLLENEDFMKGIIDDIETDNLDDESKDLLAKVK